MRICMLFSTPFPPSEGIGYHVWNLSKQLADRGHQVELITRGGRVQQVSRVTRNIRIWKAPFFPLYPLHVSLHALFVNRITRHLEDVVDLVHIHSPLAPVVQTQRPVLATFHSMMIDDARETTISNLYALLMRLQAPFSRRIESELIRRAATVCTVAPHIADSLSSYSGADGNIKIVWNGVDAATFRPDAGSVEEKDLVLVVGRLAPGKGLGDVLQAAKMARAHIPDIRFVIAGDGPLRRTLAERIAREKLDGTVILLGHIRDRERILELYRQAALFVMPSHHEGLSTVILEAMACGCAVIATDVGGTPHVIDHGESGCLIPPRNPAALADAVCRLLSDGKRRAALGARARQVVEARFTWPAIGQRYLDAYASLASGVRV